MSLYDDPPHSVDIVKQTAGSDSGGGVALGYTTVATAVPCLIDTASGSERETYAQRGITVSMTVAFLAESLPVELVRGMKLTPTDFGNGLHVRGIRKGRAMGGIPALVYADCEEQL